MPAQRSGRRERYKVTATTYWNYCRFQSATAGTNAFVVGSAAPADVAGNHDVPENCSVIGGNTYRYYARDVAGTQAEWGRGTYNTSTRTLSRDIILSNSDDTTMPVNFTTAPLVDVFPNTQRTVESPGFGAGTRMLFQQSSAPIGWIKEMSYNDWAVRIVNGTVGTGGVMGFSSAFSFRTSDGHTLTIAEMPSHSHGVVADTLGPQGSALPISEVEGAQNEGSNVVISTTATGGGGAHSHTYDMRVLYLDFIIATKS
jgi:hypothetical protein